VDLFFVLSGFLISGLLFSDLTSNGSIALRRFYLRRGLKIYPAFYFFLAGTSLLWPVALPHKFLLSEVFFLQSYLPHIWQHTWSLAVEEHFYFVLPLLLLVLHRGKRLHYLPILSLLLVIGCFLGRVATGVWSPGHKEWMLVSTHLRIDGLFAGVTLGYLYHFRSEKFVAYSRWWTGPLGFLLLLPALLGGEISFSPLKLSLLLTLNLAAFGLIVLWAVPRTYVRSRVLEEIGRYSYSIYLWHFVVAAIWDNQRGCTWVGFGGVVLTTLAVGIAMALIVEAPVLRLRDSLIPARVRKAGSEDDDMKPSTSLAEVSA